MTVQELQAKLYEMDIPHYYYNICGDGEDEDQRICLTSRDGKWLVYYSENGECQDMAEYDDESAACEDCLNRLSRV